MSLAQILTIMKCLFTPDQNMQKVKKNKKNKKISIWQYKTCTHTKSCENISSNDRW